MGVTEEGRLTWISFGIEEWGRLPAQPGVYRFYDNNGQLLYVGKAKLLSKRVGSYFQQGRSLNGKTRRMVEQIAYIMYTEVGTEHDALLLENNLIKAHQPKYNVLLRDDKSYPYVCVTHEPFSRLLGVRDRSRTEAHYIGPYTHVRAMRYLLDTLHRMYKLRTCNYDLSAKNIQQKKYKVCLEYHVGNCRGPCEGLQTEADYKTEVAQALAILKGKGRVVQQRLRNELSEAVATFHFEEAHHIKEKLSALAQLQARSVVASPTLGNLDVCTLAQQGDSMYINYMQVVDGSVVLSDSFTATPPIEENPAELLGLLLMQLREKYKSTHQEVLVNLSVSSWQGALRIHVPQQGDKKKLVALSLQNALSKHSNKPKTTPKKRTTKILRQVQRVLRLQAPPNHIESFDISNLQGQQVVAAMVCFRHGMPDKTQYRHFHIRSLQEGKPNDYAAMEEVFTRRYSRLLRERTPLPDLIVVDGGKGQLGVAVKVMEKLGIQVPIVGIAKRLEEVFLPGAKDPLPLSPQGDAMHLIQQIRDETHRFVIGFHRKMRSKEALDSFLTQIPGIGEATRTKLFKQFSSLKEIQNAPPEELIACIGKQRATTLHKSMR